MSDLISRQAARKVILDEFEGWPTDEEVAQMKRMTKQIDELPSVEPEKCGDCVSRAAAIEGADAIINHGDNDDANDVVKAMKAWKAWISALPSVEPERKTGKWLPHMVNEKCESIDRDVCSECHVCFYGEPTWSWKYCPNCGKPMEVQDGKI